MTRHTAARPRGRPPGPPPDPAVRRAEILDAAERVVARTGTPLTVAEVAAEAGFARTAVYAVFPDLPALVDALAERHVEAIMAAADDVLTRPLPGRALLRELVALICFFVDGNPNLYHLLMQRLQSDDPTGHRRPFFAGVADWAASVFERLLRSVDADPAPARVWATATVGAILMSAEDWGRHADRDRGEFVDRLTGFLWPPLEAAGADRFVGPLEEAPAGREEGAPAAIAEKSAGGNGEEGRD
ncbi:TetR/AcrR family transcriptional regulator [Nocardia sp. CDC159]|uniref:TetR/AcrR family transcriptional regulator n=1 Tax=Nocardia pulmonis TaxID=2951408 RepID=A0A9X2IVB1_9NOCA|nr:MULTISPECIES: TetR/AcrR family transcriptional regulator [Nocardia]MCM6772254.1 TetR/AcrR family transcriptional regulator [Nocardia pulmonis]MCM6785088.1 TetR/AcrR family transcriptional regulator [Nocardia sp. CDC159]